MNKKMIYETPVALSLSSSVCSGQQYEQMGACLKGGQLTSGECSAGPSPIGGICSPTGSLPELGYCRTGGNAREGCQSGSVHH